MIQLSHFKGNYIFGSQICVIFESFKHRDQKLSLKGLQYGISLDMDSKIT